MVDIINSSTIQAPSDGVSQGLYEESSSQQGTVGALRELADGRRFRYAYFNAATAAGRLVSPVLANTCLVETNDIVVAAYAAGTTDIQITLAGKSANAFDGGYLHITDDAGEGYNYRIKESSATDATTSGKVDITLYDGLVVALATTSDIAITGSLWNQVMGASSGTNYIVSGVTARVMQASYYGWVQTTGVATILSDAAVAAGDNLTLGDDGTIVGAVQTKDAETEVLIGQALFAPDDTGYVGVRLYGIE